MKYYIRITILIFGLSSIFIPFQSRGCTRQWNPVSVGKGPLLFFTQPENAAGKTFTGSGGIKTLYVFDLTNNQPPQSLWRQNDNRPDPLARIDPNNILFGNKDKLMIIDLIKGRIKSVIKTQNMVKFITFENEKIFVLDKIIPDGFMGLKLDHIEDDRTIVKEYLKPREHLYVIDIKTSNSPERFTDLEIEKILEADKQNIWAVTSGPNRKLCCLHTDGSIEEVMPFDSHWVTPLTEHQFSPNKQYLALGLYHDQDDFHSKRELIVIDLEQKNIIIRKKCELGKNLNKVGEVFNPFSLTWASDTTLWHVGDLAFGFVDIETGKQFESKSWEKYSLNIEDTMAIKYTYFSFREKIGYFDIEGFSRIYYRDHDTLVAEGDDITVSPNGEWAVYVSSEDNNTYIIDGKKKQKILLLPGRSYDFKWFPSIK